MTGLEIATLVLAMPALFEQGYKVYDFLQKDKRLKPYAENIKAFGVPHEQDKLQIYLDMAEGVLKDATVEERHKQRLYRSVYAIKTNLDDVDKLTTELRETSRFERRKRNILCQDIKDKVASVKELLSEFQQMAMSLNTLTVSESPLFLTDQAFVVLDHVRQTSNAYLNSTTFLARARTPQPLPGTQSKENTFLFECKPYTVNTKKSVKKDLELLTRKLVSIKVQHGVLRLLGFRDDPDYEEFQLVFRLPDGPTDTPLSLQNVLVEWKTPSLNFRISLCLQLGEAILHAHSLRLVHKNIRPENILLIRSSSKKSDSASSSSTDAGTTSGHTSQVAAGDYSDDSVNPDEFKVYLVGWQYARAVDGTNTRLDGEVIWQRAIYQHPDRQGVRAEKEYCMGHDIYSLGVCMIEIVLWDCLVDISKQNEDQSTPQEDGRSLSQPSKSLREAFTELAIRDANSQGSSVSTGVVDSGSNPDLELDALVEDPDQQRKVLLHLNQTRVPVTAGLKVESTVSHCITCLDDDADRTQFDISTDGDAKDVAISFVDTILRDLRVLIKVL